jgi:hypothetical protein
MYFACPQLLTSADLETAMTMEPVHEETTLESLPLLRTSCPAGAPGPIALHRPAQLLTLGRLSGQEMPRSPYA